MTTYHEIELIPAAEAPAPPRRTRKPKAAAQDAPPSPPRRKPSPRPAGEMAVMAQIQAATRRPAALLVGSSLGAFVPTAAYLIAHHEAQARPLLWVLVAAALLFSALSVYEWCSRAFGSAAKAVGFCALVEGSMLATSNEYLSCAALAVLIAINAAATGAHLATERNHGRPE